MGCITKLQLSYLFEELRIWTILCSITCAGGVFKFRKQIKMAFFFIIKYVEEYKFYKSLLSKVVVLYCM